MFRRFSTRLILRVLFLLVTLCAFAYIFGNERLVFNHVIIGLIIVAQVAELIRFVHQTNRELSRLFFAIRHNDFSITFRQARLGRSFRDLQDSLAGIVDAYRHVKIEREAQYQFLQMLINQLHVGIISLENEADVVLINPVAEQLLGMHGVRNWKLAGQLNPSFARAVAQLGDQGRKLVELKTGDETRVLSVDVRTLLIMDKAVKLVTFQDIDAEVEQKEIEAWHKLIRILTHEIMNSITPIASLTETLQGMLEERDGRQKTPAALTEETIADIRFSLNTIYKRSNSLLNFVDSYRQFTRVPRPSPERVDLQELFAAVEQLMSRELHHQDVRFTSTTGPGARYALLDRTQIEQVLINLVTNSLHALAGRPAPYLRLTSHATERNLVIDVADNGKGIAENELAEIFIPFFSTKKEGSGIGLSLSKQIVSLHGGKITVRSRPGEGTVFSLTFKLPNP